MRPTSGPRGASRVPLLLLVLVSLLVYGAVVFLNVRHYGGNLSSLIQLGDIAPVDQMAPGGFGHHVVVFVGAALVVSIVYAYRRRDVVTGGMLAHAIAALFAVPAIWLGFDGVARVFGGLYPLTVFAFARYQGRPLALLVGGVILLSVLTLLRIATTSTAPYYLTP